MGTEAAIVIVEDDFLISEYLTDLCEDMGHKVVGTAADAHTALAVIDRFKPDTILMDVRLKSREDGVDVAIAVHATSPETRIIFITGSNEPPTIARIKTDSPHCILIKPITPESLAGALA
jgi:DNA-binding NarL/FixJ family response regulator